MMNQDVKLRGTIKWHVVTSAETLTTTKERLVIQITNPTFIITGNIP